MTNNNWINHVKNFAKQNNISYKDALKNEKCKKSYKKKIIGGELSNSDVKNLIQNSYNNELSNYNDFEIDKDLSGQRVKVYNNPQTNESVVVHRGTKGSKDVFTDLKLGLVNQKNNNRYNHSKNIQKKAEQKYGANNITTVGHSLGANIASEVGQNSNQIINLNGAVTPADVLFKKVPQKQKDIRSSRDPVSILRNLQRGNKATTIKSKSYNPFKNHSSNILK